MHADLIVLHSMMSVTEQCICAMNLAIDANIFTMLLEPLPVGATLKEDEYWDYDKQADLESFSAPQVYKELGGQTKKLSREIAKQKEQVTM